MKYIDVNAMAEKLIELWTRDCWESDMYRKVAPAE